MTLSKFFELGLIKDNTEVWIRDIGEYGTRILAHGNWYQDDVVEYIDREVEVFHWQDDNVVFADMKAA